jgi:hypothetical protein
MAPTEYDITNNNNSTITNTYVDNCSYDAWYEEEGEWIKQNKQEFPKLVKSKIKVNKPIMKKKQMQRMVLRRG